VQRTVKEKPSLLVMLVQGTFSLLYDKHTQITRAGQNMMKLTQAMPWKKAGTMWQRISFQIMDLEEPVFEFGKVTTSHVRICKQ
jgi:hypothetical protein